MRDCATFEPGQFRTIKSKIGETHGSIKSYSETHSRTGRKSKYVEGGQKLSSLIAEQRIYASSSEYPNDCGLKRSDKVENLRRHGRLLTWYPTFTRRTFNWLNRAMDVEVG